MTVTFAEHLDDVAAAGYEKFYQGRHVRSWLALMGPERTRWKRVAEVFICSEFTAAKDARTAYLGDAADKEWNALKIDYRRRWVMVAVAMHCAATAGQAAPAGEVANAA